MVKLDLGCGTQKREGYLGVDKIEFPGVDLVLDFAKEPWPWADGEVEAAFSCHALEHLTALERCHFVNQLWRVMPNGAKAEIIIPHWCSNRAYGDPTHQWPPVSEMWFYYLDRAWRATHAPHTDIKYLPVGFDCDFDATWGYNGHATLATRNQAYVEFALNFYKEAAQDISATLTRKGA